MKSVLMSIQPKWCELIANEKKTVEVRKTRPKCDVPFRVYIYCTSIARVNLDEYVKLHRATSGRIDDWHGKVIGEFVCDDIQPYDETALFIGLDEISCSEIEIRSCVDLDDLLSYKGDKKHIYGWHISELKIYDEPKALGEFRKYNPFFEGISTEELEAEGVLGVRIKRPPQSWQFVERSQPK